MTFQEGQRRLSQGESPAYVSRPPGALPGGQFVEKCTGCADCVAVCPARALRLSRHGFPFLAEARKCGNCGLCADVCVRGAIEFTERTRAGFRIVLAMEQKSERW